MAIKPIPHTSIPLTDAKGLVTQAWYEYFKSRETVGLANLPDVKLTALANGDAPVWDSVTGKWTNQAN